MKILRRYALIVLILFSARILGAAPVEDRAYQWLLMQQNPNTGLLGNQEEDNFSGIYPNAVAAMCFIYKGDMERARKIFGFYQDKMQSEFAVGTPGGFRQFWNAASGEVIADTDRWIGDNAWLLMA